jgi:hypothetical protein
LIDKPQREMKKLERLNGELFEQLTINDKLLNLEKIIGGVVIATKGTMNCTVGNRIYEKSYTDKQDVTYDKEGKIIAGGCLFDIVFQNTPLITTNDTFEQQSEIVIDNNNI